jgi:hypothetical protein
MKKRHPPLDSRSRLQIPKYGIETGLSEAHINNHD